MPRRCGACISDWLSSSPGSGSPATSWTAWARNPPMTDHPVNAFHRVGFRLSGFGVILRSVVEGSRALGGIHEEIAACSDGPERAGLGRVILDGLGRHQIR